MKIPFETEKLYYGFLIFLLGYRDETCGYNITTCSSSYSLGNMLVVGIGLKTNAAQKIKKFGRFTVNIPTEKSMQAIEQAGFVSHRDKFSLTGLDYSLSDIVDAPILTDCPLVLECQVEKIIEKDNVTHIFAHIAGRKIDEKLIVNHQFMSQNFDPVYFMGDGKKRIYRYWDQERSDKLGRFRRKSQEQNSEDL